MNEWVTYNINYRLKHIVFVIVGLLSSLCAQHIAHYRLWCVVVDIGFAKLSTGRQLYNKTWFLQYIHEVERTQKNVTANLQSKSFPVEKLSAAAAGFLIGGGSLYIAYRLDSTWKLIGGDGG